MSSVVVVTKKDGKLRICLDPKDLNKAIQREHYPLPTIDEIATRLYGAKCFSILDVRNGFWHIPLDDDSHYIQPMISLLWGLGAPRNKQLQITMRT